MTKRTLESEPTGQGEQTLAPGIKPITPKDRLQLLMDAPLRPRVPQKPLCVGLFDENARNQLDFFIHSKPKKEKDHDH